MESYEANAEVQAERSMQLKVLVLEKGLDECIEYLDEDRQERWAREAQEARREAMENEMTEVELDEELMDRLVQESEENVDRLVQWFERTTERYDSSTNALYCLLLSDGYVPNISQARLNSTGSVRDIFGLDVMSPEGHSYRIESTLNGNEDGDEESLPAGYRQQVRNSNLILTNALYRLVERGTLTEFDFHTLFSVARLSASTYAFLTDAVIDLFEENYVQSFAVAMPHFEGALVDTVENAGSAALVADSDGTRQREFGGLIGEIRDDIDFEYGKYLETYYTSRQGTNLRNRWSHGQMDYRAIHFGTGITVLFDTLKAVIKLHPRPFVYSAGLPMERISTTGDTTVDFTRFIGSDEEPLGYVFDGPKGLLITEDQDREWTSFIVLAEGMRDDFGINEIGLSHEEIHAHIDSLQEDDVLDLREDIEITWLDTQDARRNQVLALIEEHADSGSVGRSRVIEQAAGFAFNDEETETLIAELESKGNIRVEDDQLYLTG